MKKVKDVRRKELRVYMALTPKEKLDYLEQLSGFFNKAMPRKSKKIWDELKKRGW